jgi:predicted dehydrogenase
VIRQNRFNVPVVKARETLEAGRFGRASLAPCGYAGCRNQACYEQDDRRGTWAYDGGVLTNQSSHYVDMLEWFFGDVVSVRARATIALVRIETEHTAGRDPEMLNGTLGFIEATTAPHPKDLEGSGDATCDSVMACHGTRLSPNRRAGSFRGSPRMVRSGGENAFRGLSGRRKPLICSSF